MGRFEGALLACDIDGTILMNGILPRRNIEAIEYFKSEGGKVCIATGRTVAALTPIISLYNGFCPSVVSNGSMIYDIENKAVVYEKCLNENEYDCIEKALEASKGVGIEIHSGEKVYTVNETQETIDHQAYEKMSAAPFVRERMREIKANKFLYLFDDKAEQERVKNAVIPAAKSSDFCDTLVTLYGKERRYLEQMPKGVSKAKTLLKLLDILNIKKEMFFAIGDGFNDMEMLEYADISACPGGAPDEVKQKADIIVGAAENGAVADFIEILKRRF